MSQKVPSSRDSRLLAARGGQKQNMINLIVGLVIGIVLTAALFVGPFSYVVGKAQAAEVTQTSEATQIPPEATTESYRALILSTLQEAGNEIQDKDLGQFYQKLLGEYHLEDSSTWLVASDNASSPESVPDLKKISSVAITMPLEEAGKQIQDKDIAQFYYKFLEDSGLQIKPY